MGKKQNHQELPQQEQKIILTPHDRFFRRVMKNPLAAQEFIQTHFPHSIAALIDSGSLQLTDSSFIDKNFQEQRSDILYKALFKGIPGYIYVLIEHQRKADPLMPIRMLEYILQICRKELANKKDHKNSQLPLIYPCVIHNGEKPYCYTTDIFEMFQDPTIAREIFLKPFTLIDLPSIPDDDLKKKPLVGMLEMHLKYAGARDTLGFIKKIVDLLHQLESMNQIDIIQAGAYYLFQTSKDGTSRHDILEEFKKHLNPPTQSEIMTIAEAFVEEGVKKGRQEGRQEGFRSLLIKQLNCRFPNQVRQEHLRMIEEAESDKLFYWGENLMKATTIEEVFSCF
ncbi:MAG: Rpn family recombination-promoting nuclease/putative transposase [Chthoniobacterales bacterium]|nr:Rpn family recombination-promoting nuclease/putative transposase [Chthoniobacterales bacterium]